MIRGGLENRHIFLKIAEKTTKMIEPTLTLALLRAGAPNSEILSAKSLDDLLDIAERNSILIPANIMQKLEKDHGTDDTTPTPNENTPSAALSPDSANGSKASFSTPPPSLPNGSPALSRAKLWRYQYMAERLEAEQAERAAGEAGSPDASVAKPTGEASAAPREQPREQPRDRKPREVGLYEGERNEYGERDGEGACRYANGIAYVGGWRANLPEGRGRVLYPNGDVFEGWFAMGVREGSGTLALADGRIEVARYVAGANSRGEGAMWSADRRIAWRIVKDGEEVEEISLEESYAVAERVGEPVPGRYWREERQQLQSQAPTSERAIEVETARAAQAAVGDAVAEGEPEAAATEAPLAAQTAPSTDAAASQEA